MNQVQSIGQALYLKRLRHADLLARKRRLGALAQEAEQELRELQRYVDWAERQEQQRRAS